MLHTAATLFSLDFKRLLDTRPKFHSEQPHG